MGSNINIGFVFNDKSNIESILKMMLAFLNEDKLLPNYSMQALEKASNVIINFVEEIYPILKFDYAICDHEVEIELSPHEFKPGDYSLSFLPGLSNASLNIKNLNP